MPTLTLFRLLARASVITASLSGLASPAALPWLPIDPGPDVHADLRGAIVQGSAGYQVYFKNFGTKPIHFGFYLGGPQTSDSASANRRLHLRPGNAMGPLDIKPEPGIKGELKLHVVAAVEGNVDGAAS
jgi:hypothetical protein